jgi:hypothetical protein
MLEWFIRLGHRWFAPNAWHRVPFQPILFFFVWGATVRVVWTERNTPIPFEILTPYTATAWAVMGLICPPLTLLAWWLVRHCTRSWASFIGMWLRLIGDMGQFLVLMIYHVVVVYTRPAIDDNEIYFRYLTGACLVFAMLLVVRDIWALVLTERLATLLYRKDPKR